MIDNPCTPACPASTVIIVLMMQLKVKIATRQSSQIIVFPQSLTIETCQYGTCNEPLRAVRSGQYKARSDIYKEWRLQTIQMFSFLILLLMLTEEMTEDVPVLYRVGCHHTSHGTDPHTQLSRLSIPDCSITDDTSAHLVYHNSA